MEYVINRKTVQKNNGKQQNRNKFRSKPKTTTKVRADLHAVEARILRRKTGKTPNCIEELEIENLIGRAVEK